MSGQLVDPVTAMVEARRRAVVACQSGIERELLALGMGVGVWPRSIRLAPLRDAQGGVLAMRVLFDWVEGVAAGTPPVPGAECLVRGEEEEPADVDTSGADEVGFEDDGRVEG
jgi:hypothetical protein